MTGSAWSRKHSEGHVSLLVSWSVLGAFPELGWQCRQETNEEGEK